MNFQFTQEQYELLLPFHEITFEQLNKLPEYLKGMIVSYGFGDTEVGDRLYELGIIKD
jgi:hypothetical protein